MASDSMISKACLYLKQMPQYGQDTWFQTTASGEKVDAFPEPFEAQLQFWDDDILGRVAIEAFERLDRRPTYKQLLDIALDLECPMPTADEAFVEVMWYAQNRGLDSRIDPERPTIRRRGAPTWSHPAIQQAVDAVGGWEVICCSDMAKIGVLQAQFSGAYDDARERWRVQAKRQAVRVADRDPRLFPLFRSFDPSRAVAAPSAPKLLPSAQEQHERESRDAALAPRTDRIADIAARMAAIEGSLSPLPQIPH